MRVVVVGSTGNVGIALVDALVAGGAEVLGLARRRPTAHGVAGFRQADITTDDLVGHFRGADVVVHLAWIFQPTHRPSVTWRVNVEGTERVLRAAAEAGVGALVCASSVGAYSPGPGHVVDESWPTHGYPEAAYGREKAYVERLLDIFAAERPNVRVVRLRPGFIFQPAAGPQQVRLFAGPLAPTSLLRPGRLPVVPWPAGLRIQALHAADAAEAYRLAIESDASGAFNIAADPVVDEAAAQEVFGARVVTIPPELAKGALRVGWLAHLVPAEPALLDLARSLPVMSTERARRVLGWSPRSSSVEALRAGLAGMAEGAGGPTPPLQPASLGSSLRGLARRAGKA
ncbi:MAG TPA: NAD-dependent epimerase/dehydratase family protein [Acidimicrobiales bacterium]|nr:NAD-dependent epimerase/dehydratase family protein [Acidimicrobiales bacterium]